METLQETDDISVKSEDEEDGNQDFNEDLDPRIMEELEKLNAASNRINILEKELDESRAVFRNFLTDATKALQTMHSRLGQCIDKARPYFEANEQAKKAQELCQEAAVQYDKACNVHRGAKETISTAEKKIQGRPGAFDATWQEMLNHADIKLLEAEKNKIDSERAHEEAAMAYRELEARAIQLEKQLKKAVAKARPYYKKKTAYLEFLKVQKDRVMELEIPFDNEKKKYANALKKLEEISEEIHEKRQKMRAEGIPLEPRQECIGAEDHSFSETSPPSSSPTQHKTDSLSRNEARLKRILSRKRKPFTKSALRSSLCLELGIGTEFDIGNVLESPPPHQPQSPSTQSIDLGSVLSRSFEEYAVLEINGQELLDREYPNSKTKEQISPQKSLP
eukprot:gene3059-3522_t